MRTTSVSMWLERDGTHEMSLHLEARLVEANLTVLSRGSPRYDGTCRRPSNTRW